MNKEVRKGLVNHEVNKEFFPFIIFESLVFSGVVTYFGATLFDWNGIATFIITIICTMILSYTPAYHVFGLLFSVGWGYLGYKLLSFIITVTGGGNGLVITLGIIGFLLGFVLSLGARIGGKEYLDDIGN